MWNCQIWLVLIDKNDSVTQCGLIHLTREHHSCDLAECLLWIKALLLWKVHSCHLCHARRDRESEGAAVTTSAMKSWAVLMVVEKSCLFTLGGAYPRTGRLCWGKWSSGGNSAGLRANTSPLWIFVVFLLLDFSYEEMFEYHEGSLESDWIHLNRALEHMM